jgi:hypothetical protein
VRTIGRITYQARAGSSGKISETGASFTDRAASEHWDVQLEPWLRLGSQESLAYLNFGTEAAFLRWYAEPRSRFDWELAQVHVGPSDLLTGTYALDLDNPVRGGAWPEASSAEAVGQLVPLLAHALRGERHVIMPWTTPLLPEAVMRGLIEILGMIGDQRPVSFFSYLSSPRPDAELPGLFVGFRPGTTAVLPADPGFMALAESLTFRFASDPDELREFLARHGATESADHAGPIGRLLQLLPEIQGGGGRTEGTVTKDNSRSGRHSRPEKVGEVVKCPMCLHEIQDWNSLDYWRWNPDEEEYREVSVDPDLNETQRNWAMYGSSVRCPSPQGEKRIGPHYLPADYGRYGPPIVLGFVGLTKSGKSHLLASMVGAIMGRELQKHAISSSALDQAWHRRFMDQSVSPLLKHDKVLPGTPEGLTVAFADAFLIKGKGGKERVVALFDVAGGDLARLNESKEFLWIVNGLFFVVDPDRMTDQWADDATFSQVLDVVRRSGRQDEVSAAIVLNKADLLRFDEPVDRWLLSEDVPGGGRLEAVEFLRESADIYAFLEDRRALAMAEAYEVCGKATMHVVSPTGGAETGGGGVYPRGVTPRRVLRPLIAMLAMTGALTGSDAEQVGV